jgi:hypothetical protein
LFLVRVVRGKRFGIVSSAALGLAVGVACLSKYSGLTLVMTTCFVYAVFLVIKVEQRRRMIISFLVASGVFFALTSPFYFRNIKKYGKALPVNTEFAKVNLEYFDLSFFLDPTRIGFGAVDKFVSRASSFVDGTYSSAWIDNSHKSYSWMKLFEVSIYYLGIFPTVITGAGFIRAIKGCRTDSENGRTYLVLSVMLIFGSFSYLYFILRFGTFEIVKAFYLLSWVSPISVFFELGRRDEIGPTRPSPVFAVPQLILYNFIIVYYLLVPVLKGAGT